MEITLKKKNQKSAPTLRGLSVRRKEFDAASSAFDTFNALQKSLISGLESDKKALEREISIRDGMIQDAERINGLIAAKAK